ncbi:MAG: MFS transporter [Candidatus Izemoplasmatales bacterium]|nr:MFS transporter [Candidatus Izemoplasmatales bacterium]
MIKETFKFKLFYFIRYFGDALFYPFMSLYFISKGVTEAELGLILAITPIATILVNPVWNFLARDMRAIRVILKVMTLIEGILIIVVTQISGFELYALVICLIAMLCSPFISIQDGFTATFANQNNIEYTSIRIHASIAYVVASAIAGLVIVYLGYTVLFVVAGMMFILTMLIAFWIKPLKDELQRQNAPQRDIKALLRNREFYKYLIFYTLMVGAVRVGDSFFGVYMTGVKGLDATQYGFLYAAFILAEVIVIRVLINKGQLISERKLMIISALLFALRFVAYSFIDDSVALSVITILRGIAWGIFLFANIRYIMKIVKVENVTPAIMIITLLFSVFTAVGNFLFGRFVNNMGYSWLYLILAGIIGLGFVVILVLSPKITYENDAISSNE